MAVAQPTDVVKVRFQAQARAGGGRRYQSTVDAYKTIAREEGIRGLWKGVCVLGAGFSHRSLVPDTLGSHKFFLQGPLPMLPVMPLSTVLSW